MNNRPYQWQSRTNNSVAVNNKTVSDWLLCGGPECVAHDMQTVMSRLMAHGGHTMVGTCSGDILVVLCLELRSLAEPGTFATLLSNTPGVTSILAVCSDYVCCWVVLVTNENLMISLTNIHLKKS